MRGRVLGSVLAVVALAAAQGCGGVDSAKCKSDYGFVVDGGACTVGGDSHSDCPTGASCTCSGSVTLTVHICSEGTCVTAIDNCEAWCSASAEQRMSCM